MRPEDLLNRWIVPLESRVDYLTLHTGKKFQVPFDVLTVFATNLDPLSLADEAFLRRIPYKIEVGDPTIEQFTRILEMNCRRRDLRFHPVIAAYLQRRHYAPIGRRLRSCHPRDLLDQVTALCRYRGIEPVLNRDMLDAACDAYFIDQSDEPPAEPAAAPVKKQKSNHPRRHQIEVR
jgi:SpoVK/Ycf46/Vps4 family AAA+-type ATPase